MRVQIWLGLAAAVTLGGGCLQAMSYVDATLDPSCCAGGGGPGGSGGTTGTMTTTSSGGGAGGGPSLCKPGTTMSCYSGDMATLKVGACKAGTQTCSPSGKEYGPCVGEVLPGTEDCSKPEDEDCNGLACSQTVWAKQFGDTASQGSSAIAVDKKSGDVYIAGSFSGGIQFGNDNLIEVGNGDAFLAKFDANGSPIWAKRFGDAQSENAIAVAVDSSQNVIILALGSFGDGNVKKLNSDGDLIWTVSCGESFMRSLTTNQAGDVILAGALSGSSMCNGTSLTSTGGLDVMVAKLAADDGKVQWAQTFGDKADQGVSKISSDSNDNIYMTGYFAGSLKFSFDVTILGNNDAFVAKLNDSGVATWARTLGNGTGAYGSNLAVDSLGATIVAGTYKGNISLNGTGTITNPSAVEKNGFIAKIDSSGAGVWLMDAPKSAGGFVAIDSINDVLIASSEKDGTLAVSKFGGDGTVVWSRVFGVSGAAMAVGTQNEVFLSGSFKGALDFDSFMLNTNSATNYDIFLVKLAP